MDILYLCFETKINKVFWLSTETSSICILWSRFPLVSLGMQFVFYLFDSPIYLYNTLRSLYSYYGLDACQVAGVPTNINFLQKLADHRAFESGNVETHFIEHYKDDLFTDPNNLTRAKETYDNARFSATLVAACLCEKEHSAIKSSLPGRLKDHSNFPLHVTCSFGFLLSHNIFLQMQGPMGYSQYGILIPLFEPIIKLVVPWSLNGRMNMMEAAPNFLPSPSLISQMGTILLRCLCVCNEFQLRSRCFVSVSRNMINYCFI